MRTVAAFAAAFMLAVCTGDAPVPAAGDGSEVEGAVNPNAPGVRQVGIGRYEAVVYAYDGGYDPREIRVPAGSEVTFRASSRDDPHGFQIEGTEVELDVYPGRFSEARHTFGEPGEYRFVCHVYCGGGHDMMRGRVIVE